MLSIELEVAHVSLPEEQSAAYLAAVQAVARLWLEILEREHLIPNLHTQESEAGCDSRC